MSSQSLPATFWTMEVLYPVLFEKVTFHTGRRPRLALARYMAPDATSEGLIVANTTCSNAYSVM